MVQLTHEEVNQDSMLFFKTLFIEELEKIDHAINSNAEAERIANLIILGVDYSGPHCQDSFRSSLRG